MLDGRKHHAGGQGRAAVARAGRRMSTRRLRKSLALGRVANAADLLPDDSDNGQENHIPLVNRFCGWWRRLQTSRFLATATR
jgi:hypothetical protein